MTWFASAPAAADPLVYVGEYTCGAGQQRSRLRLVIDSLDAAPISGEFHFETYKGSIATGSYRLSGTYDSVRGKLRLMPAGWIVRPSGYNQVGVDGVFSKDGAVLAGNIVDPTCEKFRVTRRGKGVSQNQSQKNRSVPEPED